MQNERWRSMDATPGEGEGAKGGERQEVARALPPMDGRLARYPLSRETSRSCCPCVDCEGNMYASDRIIITFCSGINKGKGVFYERSMGSELSGISPGNT